MASKAILDAYKRGKKARNNANKKGVVTTQPTQKKKPTNKQNNQTSKPKTTTSYKATTQTTKRGGKGETDSWQAYVNKNVLGGGTSKRDLQSAYERGKNTSGLGTKIKTKTYDTGITAKDQRKAIKDQKSQYYGSKDWKTAKEDIKKANRKAWRDALKEAGYNKEQSKEWMNSEQGKEYRKDSYYQMKDRMKGAVNKSVEDSVKKNLPTKGKYKALNRDEYLKLQNAERLTGGKKIKNAALGKDLSKKVGALNAKDYAKDAGVIGALEGSNPLPVSLEQLGSGMTTAGQKATIAKAKESGAYKAGYGVGMAASFALNRTGAMGKGLAQAGKGVAKTTAGRIARNVAGDAIVSSPLNFTDAIKNATDANGKVNVKQAAALMGINTAFDVGIGGAIDGAGAAFTKASAKNLIKLQAKANVKGLTKEESDKLAKLYDRLNKVKNDTQSSGQFIAGKGYTNAKGLKTAGIENTANEIADNARKAQGGEIVDVGANIKATEDTRIANTQANNAKVDEITTNARINDLDSRIKKLSDIAKGSKDESAITVANNNIKKLEAEKQTLTDSLNAKVDTENINASDTTITQGKENVASGEKVAVKAREKPTVDLTANADAARNVKEEQLKIINKTNPANDDLHLWIRNADDIKKFDEAVNSEEAVFTPDYDSTMANKAIETGKIQVYSSKPIEDGAFVSPSKQIAKDYAGEGKIYSKTMKLDDVAWVDSLEGQVAKLSKSNANVKDSNIRKTSYIKKEDVSQGKITPKAKTKKIDAKIRGEEVHLKNAIKKYGADSDRVSEIKSNIENLKTQANETRNASKTDGEKIVDEYKIKNLEARKAQATLNGINEAIRRGDNIPEAKLKEAEDAVKSLDADQEVLKIKLSSADGGKFADIVENNFPSNQTILERAGEIVSGKEFSVNAKENINEVLKSVSKDESLGKVVTKDAMIGGKVNAENAAEQARQAVKANYNTALSKFESMNFREDRELAIAKASELLDEQQARLKSNPDDAEAMADMQKVITKLSNDSLLNGRGLETAKRILRATPEGRLRIVDTQISNLNTRYRGRIKGGILKLTDEQQAKILNATTDEEVDSVLNDINIELFDNINATLFEKWNEIRHCAMLFNFKTHARNVIGNTFYRLARGISNGMESEFNKLAKSHIEKLGGQVDFVKVSRKEIAEKSNYLDDEFNETYDPNISQQKFKETSRPDGSPIVKNKAIDWFIQNNYKALEWEDIKLAFKPEFKREYVRICKARNWDIENLTKSQQEFARDTALKKAEIATFRNTTAFSTWLTKTKIKTASKQGNTIFGTLGYRALNSMLEGTVPFVKTPVNIFGRTIDYSPISLIRAVGKLASKDADVFKTGIHDLSTGLTGTGVAGLGYYLAMQGMVTVNAGDESGDEFFDRDMGYQDYSLVIGGKSFKIDWASPIQSSLFFGAAICNMIDEGLTQDQLLSGLFSLTNPILDTSFMSGTKDMIEQFTEQASRGRDDKDTDYAGAVAQLLLGTIPANYISGSVPQLLSQVAGATDTKLRDTRSTSNNFLIKSWESSAKKLVNRIPVLRQYLLNPKLDRHGDDISTGDNIATRIFSSMINPSVVKDITRDKYDDELIKIHNGIKEKNSDDYKYFFYNFTGNPNMDVGDRRMTYDELYKYGKVSRKEQTKLVRDMVDAESYKVMTNDMKSKEVSGAYWTSQIKADWKTIGAKYALGKALKEQKTDKEIYKEYQRLKGKGKQTNEDFVDYYIKKEEFYSRCHPASSQSYAIKGLAAKMYAKDPDTMLKACNVYKSTTDNINAYYKAVKKEASNTGQKARDIAYKEISNFTCSATSEIDKAEVYASKGTTSIAAAISRKKGIKANERTYRAMGFNWQSAQAGAGLMLKYNSNNKYSLKNIDAMKSMIKSQYDVNGSGSVNKSEVVAFIDSLGVGKDEASCLFEVLYSSGNYKNPYGVIKDHLKWNTTPDAESNGGGRGGRYGHHGGGGSSSKGDWFNWYDSNINVAKSTKSKSTKDNTSKSALDEAYRKRLRSYIKKAR